MTEHVFGMDMDLDDIPERQGGGGRGGGGRGRGRRGRGRGGGRAGGGRGGGFGGRQQHDRPRQQRRSYDRDRGRGGGRGGYGSGYQRTIYKDRDGYEPRPTAPAAFVTAKNRTETMLLVHNLAEHVTTDDIKEIFSSKGALRKAFVNFDDKGISRGTAEVVFEDPRDAQAAFEAYQGLKVDSVPLKLVLIKGDESGFNRTRQREPRRPRGGVDDDIDAAGPAAYSNGRGGGRGGGRGYANGRQHHDGDYDGGRGRGRGVGGPRGRGAGRHESARNPLLRLDDDDADDQSGGGDNGAPQSKAELFGSALRGGGGGNKGRGGRRGRGRDQEELQEADLDAALDTYHQSGAPAGADGDDGGDDQNEDAEE